VCGDGGLDRRVGAVSAHSTPTMHTGTLDAGHAHRTLDADDAHRHTGNPAGRLVQADA
jgi:hypothetical protein